MGSSHPFRLKQIPGRENELKSRSRDWALAGAFAALYAILVYVFSPISFYTLQFRVAGILRPSIAKKWILAVGYAVGVVVGNLFSPFVGPFELVFMPLMSFLAGGLGFVAAKPFKRDYFVAGFVIASVISLSVSWMLNQMFGIPMLVTLPYLFISEQVLCFGGAIIFRLIDARFRWW